MARSIFLARTNIGSVLAMLGGKRSVRRRASVLGFLEMRPGQYVDDAWGLLLGRGNDRKKKKKRQTGP